MSIRTRAVGVVITFMAITHGTFLAAGLWFIPQLLKDDILLASNLSATWLVLISTFFIKASINVVDASYEAALNDHNRQGAP